MDNEKSKPVSVPQHCGIQAGSKGFVLKNPTALLTGLKFFLTMLHWNPSTAFYITLFWRKTTFSLGSSFELSGSLPRCSALRVQAVNVGWAVRLAEVGWLGSSSSRCVSKGILQKTRLVSTEEYSFFTSKGVLGDNALDTGCCVVLSCPVSSKQNGSVILWSQSMLCVCGETLQAPCKTKPGKIAHVLYHCMEEFSSCEDPMEQNLLGCSSQRLYHPRTQTIAPSHVLIQKASTGWSSPELHSLSSSNTSSWSQLLRRA